MKRRISAAAALLFASAMTSLLPAAPAAAQPVAEAPAAETNTLLTIGSTAPAVDIEHWVQTGGGRFEPITNFAEGEVYVVEFWATWCPPCVASMPHLSALQTRYADRGVTIISVSAEPLETVTAFLDKEADGQIADAPKNDAGEPLTFKQITAAYCLTTDPDGSTNAAYMEAAQRDGIPCAFIVGKTGLVEWIGHPMQLDDPLEQVVADAWDREAFAVVFKAEQRFQSTMQQIMMLTRAGRADEARSLLDALVDEAPTPRLKAQAMQAKVQVEFGIYQNLVVTDQPRAAEKLVELATTLNNDPRAVNSLTWLVVQQGMRGDVAAELLQAAVDTVDPIVEDGKADASLVDTLAHLVHLQGDVDRAIELEKAASAAATGRLKQSIDAFLEQLQAEKAEASAAAEG